MIIDAQQYDTNLSRSGHTWVSQNVGVKVLPDNGLLKRATQLATSPQLSYKVNFSHSGRHYLWVRGSGDAVNGEGKSDSLHVGLDGRVQAGSDKLDGFGSQWEWRRSTRDGQSAMIDVPATGLHEITLWMREDGLAVDKLLLTNDPGYQPVGSNPDTTASDDSGSDSSSNGNDNNGSDNSGNTDGTGATQAQLDISTLDLDFGSVAERESSSRQLRLKNSGSAELNFSQIVIQGTAADSFQIAANTPIQLARGEEIALNLEFFPTDAGEHVAILSLSHDPDNTLSLISLTGLATAVEDPVTTDDPTGSNSANSQYFINTGGPDVIGTNGIVWTGDANAGVNAFIASPTLTYTTTQTVSTSADIQSLGAVPALFSTERYSANMADMHWNFPVTPGDYQVHLFFAEIFKGAAQVNGRVFGINIEGDTLIDSLDVYAQSGSSHRALVRSFMISSDNNLSLTLLGLQQNPAIKAIAIVPCQASCNTTNNTSNNTDETNHAPIADAGHDQQRVIGDVLSLTGRVSDDGLPSAQLTSHWSQVAGPAAITFAEISDPLTTATFPAMGVYRLRLTASDGQLNDYDELQIIIVDGQQHSTADYLERNGQVLIEAEAYSQRQASSTHSWQLQNSSSAMLGQSMLSGPNLGTIAHTITASPMLAYTVDFDSAGKRYVWVRGLGDSDVRFEGKNDSLHVGLNGTLSQTADKMDRFPAHWSWTNHTRDGIVASIDIPSAGVHTINVWMREDGLQFDQLYLTRQPGDNPATR